MVGERASRGLYVALVAGAYALALLVAVLVAPWALLALAAAALAIRPTRLVLQGTTGRALVPVLRDTGLAELVFAALLATGLALSG